ncbi:Hypothetical protein D9617_11g008410 [Elsinoe fawcettii]|nr:Hypothetical protein D9617_11g008410 [Elsinoe fawcettii]
MTSPANSYTTFIASVLSDAYHSAIHHIMHDDLSRHPCQHSPSDRISSLSIAYMAGGLGCLIRGYEAADLPVVLKFCDGSAPVLDAEECERFVRTYEEDLRVHVDLPRLTAEMVRELSVAVNAAGVVVEWNRFPEFIRALYDEVYVRADYWYNPDVEVRLSVRELGTLAREVLEDHERLRGMWAAVRYFDVQNIRDMIEADRERIKRLEKLLETDHEWYDAYVKAPNGPEGWELWREVSELEDAPSQEEFGRYLSEQRDVWGKKFADQVCPDRAHLIRADLRHHKELLAALEGGWELIQADMAEELDLPDDTSVLEDTVMQVDDVPSARLHHNTPTSDRGRSPDAHAGEQVSEI